MLRIDRLLHPITTLGYGKRAALWVKGCSIRCPACASKDLWSDEGGIEIEELALAERVADIVVENQLDGLTITGGEPSDQLKSVVAFIRGFRKMLDVCAAGKGVDVDILVFTGRDICEIEERFPEIMSGADALVCGPYLPDRPSEDWLLGSANQEMVLVSDLAFERYGAPEKKGKTIQFTVRDGDIVFAGITGQGELPRIEEALKSRGVTLGGRSWTNK